MAKDAIRAYLKACRKTERPSRRIDPTEEPVKEKITVVLESV